MGGMADRSEHGPAYLVVDGHSMVFSWSDLNALHRRSPAAARSELLRRLTTLHDLGPERIVLVFDGSGERPDATAARDPESVQVFYSSAGSTADLLIERLAAKYAASRPITVASRDRAVLDTCSAAGADAISAEALLERVERAEADLAARLRR